MVDGRAGSPRLDSVILILKSRVLGQGLGALSLRSRVLCQYPVVLSPERGRLSQDLVVLSPQREVLAFISFRSRVGEAHLIGNRSHEHQANHNSHLLPCTGVLLIVVVLVIHRILTPKKRETLYHVDPLLSRYFNSSSGSERIFRTTGDPASPGVFHSPSL